MNWDVVKGNWNQFKGKAREEWGELTHDDLDKLHGDYDQFVGKLQEKYGWSRDEAKRRADTWAERHAKTSE